MVNTDEIAVKDKDGGEIETNDTSQDTNQTKQRTVSFNSDVHVKRFGKPRESRGSSSEPQSSPVRKEPFTNLSEKELIAEANKVLEQAESVTCTADHPPDKFFSLPHRRKFKEHEKIGRRNSDENGEKTPLGRSTSDVGKKRSKERTSISTLFRRAQKNKVAEAPVVVSTKPTVVIKRSKSDVSDLKSNTTLQPKPIRKRSGSETEEFLKSLRNKKTQLSPIIESSPREDYFRKTPPLELFQKQKLAQKDSVESDDQKQSTETQKVNPVEKPPRYKSPEKTEPKPPIRTKRGKSAEKDQKENSPPIGETPKRKTQFKKTLLVDEIDNLRGKEQSKNRIQDSIKKIEENVYGSSDMIHSSQKPPDKPPLTRGHTVDHIVRILKEDQFSPPPKAHLILPPNSGSNNNQPFSYFKPSVSPDPNLYIRTTSPERVPSPVNKMNPDKGVVYAQVVRGDRGGSPANLTKQTIHKTYSPSKDKFGNLPDEDEGLGHEDQKNKFNTNKYDYNKNENENFNSLGSYKLTDSPIRPKFREYKLTSFDNFEPTYANEYPAKEDRSDDFIDTAYRGRGDGMDSKRKVFVEPETAKADVDFNELSHRRELLESRLKARYDRERKNGETLTRYMADDSIYEAEKRMKATEKYVNETAKYYRHNTLERDGFTEDSVTESFRKYDDNIVNKYHNERRPYEADRPEFIDRRRDQNRFIIESKSYPPEPEYEPPSLEISKKKSILTPDEYKEKKYRVRSKLTTSHDTLQSGHKYKKDSWFGKRKGHYASNPEIGREDYVNADFDPKNRESYHNSLKRDKHRSKDYNMRRHDSNESREYYRTDTSPRRYEGDNCLVDSGIVNDFRKSSGDLRSNWYRRGSDDDVRDTSVFLQNERRHTEDVYPSEQIYANGEYVTRFEDFPRQSYVPRERSADDGSHFDPRIDRFDKSPSRNDKANAKPPKAVKKLSGLEKMKQLFSRDSSKKSKKEKDMVQTKSRTRVLKSPEHLVRRDSDYRRYRDPEPSDEEAKKYDLKGSDTERRYRSSDPESDMERKYRNDLKEEYRQERFTEFRGTEEQRRYENDRLKKQDARRYGSSDRESEQRSPRASDVERQTKSRETSRKSRSMTADSLDSPALAERYRERRRLATPSPTPSPPRRAHPPQPPPTTAGNWFKSLDRLARKRAKSTKTQKENRTITENEARHSKLNSPAKNLRFFGDTDLDSNASKQTISKTKSHPEHSLHRSTLRKTNSNSSAGVDETDFKQKSHSLSNLNSQKRLHNISENYDRESNKKPPIPYDRRSRSQSSTKAGTGRRPERSVERDRESSSDVRGSKQELNRELKHRRRTPANNSGESSTEGDSSHQSQRSVVYLHATTVGDIPDPGRVGRNRSRDDVSVNSSQIQIRTTAKSFSLFAPWTPRHYPDHHDVHYSQKTRRQSKPRDTPSNVKKNNEGTLVKNKSYSQTTLTKKPQNSRLTSSSQTLYRKPEKKQDVGSRTLSRSRHNDKSHSTEVLRDNERERVSRSISMPKDNSKKAGWFKLSSKNKKPEINTRVR